MISDIKIGKKTITMAANAATCYRYKQCFKKDLFQVIRKFDENSDQEVETIQELAYVMAMQGAKRAAEISLADYMNWLDEFEAMDILNASADIIGLYIGQTGTSSKAKKKVDQQSGS